MFTGIVESVGKITDIKVEGTNQHFTIESTLEGELYIDQSIAHNGVCLTIVALSDTSYTVTAIKETLDKSNLGQLKIGESINLEQAVTSQKRMDGHFVQGHVDTTVTCDHIEEVGGSWYFSFSVGPEHLPLIVEKGSICLNGVSLTISDILENGFRVAIIPFTYQHTTFNTLTVGQKVNVEFDILGKYVQRYLSLQAEK